MLELYIICYAIFWVIFYIIQGWNDGTVILWQESTQSTTLTKEQSDKALVYNEKWHKIDFLEKAIVHLVITLPVLFFGGTIFLAASVLCLSISIRWLVMDAVINKVREHDVNHIGSVSLIDKWLKSMCDKGISQWTIKGGLFILFTLATVILLLI